MEECYSGSKRKKRKTRKCLNEIRKKSRMNTNSASATKGFELESKMNNKVANVVRSHCNNNYITSNRLTLAIFPKAVRSETITRPLLAEIRHEPGNINLNNIVKSKYPMNSEITNTTHDQAERSDSFNLSKNGPIIFSDEDESDDIAVENGVDSQIFRMKSSSVAGSSFERSPAAASPAPPPTGGPEEQARERHAYRMYEHFVKNIPMFIKIHAPSLLADDAMKKPKAALHSMYAEGRRRRRLAEAEAEAEAAPAPGPRSAEPASPSPAPPTERSIIQDTPEYTYFPHKLNQ